MVATYFSGFETVERESLLDTISILHINETPLLRTLPHTQVTRRIVEYPIDRYFQSSDNVRSAASPHTNTRGEGSEFVIDDADYPVRLRAVCEINHFSKRMSNTDREAIIAGVTDPFDYRSHQLFVKLLNNIENVLMYGTGSPEEEGEVSPPWGTGSPGSPVSSGDERRALGLIFWSAWSGLERIHGTATGNLADPYNISYGTDYWSTFYDAQGTNLSRQMFYNKILANAARQGTFIDGMLFHVGYKLKNLIADLGTNLSGNEVNQRNVPADSLMTYDSIDWIRTPQGTVGFRSNRYLDIEGSTYTVDNRGAGATFTPGSPTEGDEGTINKTFQADETMIGYMPGYASVGWYRPPHYQNVPTTGDYSQVAAVAEYSLIVRHPVALAGGGNLLG